MTQIYKLAFFLFILMDAIGNIPIFISVLKKVPPKRQRSIILRELVIALFVIIAFVFLGEFVLSALKVDQATVMISGGLILFLIALKMIFPSPEPVEEKTLYTEPLIVPLAIPLVAGPAILAAVMIYAKQEGRLTTVIATFLAWAASAAILLCSLLIRKLIGERGISACEKLMGLILTLISIQMFLEGVKAYARICSS